ncbi:MAG TPA: hypothetical protein VGR26_13260 [Acidimicrobiales bacterium]|nr:hypothetical protein [Acidimicrobiales bacterium]
MQPVSRALHVAQRGVTHDLLVHAWKASPQCMQHNGGARASASVTSKVSRAALSSLAFSTRSSRRRKLTQRRQVAEDP